MSTGPVTSFCIVCGERLSPAHRHCPACGAERWQPGTATTPAEPAPPADVERTPVPGLAWVYGVGAVCWLLLLAIDAGELAAGPTRAQMAVDVRSAGYPADLVFPVLVVYAIATVLVPLVIAVVHAAAFYGLRSGRRWGWLAAVVVAGGWSLVLVGVPILATLLRPSVRRAYGVG